MTTELTDHALSVTPSKHRTSPVIASSNLAAETGNSRVPLSSGFSAGTVHNPIDAAQAEESQGIATLTLIVFGILAGALVGATITVVLSSYATNLFQS